MRIIGGDLGGRVLAAPLKKWPTRPTTDIAREALYNILANRIDFTSIKMLDLFGGTGAHVLECVSRGCVNATYVDRHRGCASWVKDQVGLLGLEEYIVVICQDVKKYLKSPKDKPFDLIFADPPYALRWIKSIPESLFEMEVLSQEGLLIIEHGSDTSFVETPGFREERKYGQSRFSFFKNPS